MAALPPFITYSSSNSLTRLFTNFSGSSCEPRSPYSSVERSWTLAESGRDLDFQPMMFCGWSWPFSSSALPWLPSTLRTGFQLLGGCAGSSLSPQWPHHLFSHFQWCLLRASVFSSVEWDCSTTCPITSELGKKENYKWWKQVWCLIRFITSHCLPLSPPPEPSGFPPSGKDFDQLHKRQQRIVRERELRVRGKEPRPGVGGAGYPSQDGGT